MHAKWMCYALTKELEQLKLSSSTESATADKFITKKTQGSSVKCWDHCDEIKTIKSKVPSINYPYFAKIFKFLLKNWSVRENQVIFCFLH